eukprot:gb/GECG01007365.1/.p1 GENE.gb/GECG01007365.1/~~gb/GECG01007365.1/.p1  ORF type:complete len:1501 (+),score=205.28 gb/GECG01007365.1/:1-4503(+)
MDSIPCGHGNCKYRVTYVMSAASQARCAVPRLTQVPLFHPHVTSRVATDTTISSLLGVICAIAASLFPFPHWSISEVQARLMIAAEMCEGAQRMNMNAFTREIFLRGGKHRTKTLPYLFEQATSPDRTSSRTSAVGVMSENQAIMGLESVAPTLSWQERSPLLHASTDHLQHVLKINIDRIEREIPCVKWEGPGITAFFKKISRRISLYSRQNYPNIKSPRASSSRETNFPAKVTRVISGDNYQLMDNNNTPTGTQKGWTTSLNGDVRTLSELSGTGVNDRSTWRNQLVNLRTQSGITGTASCVNDQSSVASDGGDNHLDPHTLLNRENENFESKARWAYSEGHRSKEGKRNLIEKLNAWHTNLQKLRQTTLLMSESQRQTDLVANFREEVATSLCDVISATVDASTSLLHAALFVSLRNHGCAANIGCIWAPGGTLSQAISTDLLKQLQITQSSVNLSSELSSDKKSHQWYEASDGSIVPTVSKPGSPEDRRRLYQLRHYVLKMLRELTKKYGQVRMRILYKNDQRPQGMVQLPNNIALRQHSFYPPSSVASEKREETSHTGTTKNRIRGNESVESEGSDTQTQTSFDRQSEQEQDDTQTNAMMLSAAMAPISTFLFCVIRTAWLTIESADELCGLKHASNESEEGEGEDRKAPLHASVNVNMSAVERQQSLQQRETQSGQIACDRNPQNVPVFASPELSKTLNRQDSDPGGFSLGTPLVEQRPAQQKVDAWPETRAWYQKETLRARRNFAGKAAYEISELFQRAKEKVIVRRAVHVTAAVVASTALPIVPYLRERFPYSYWAPVSAAFIAGTSAGSNFRGGSIRLLGTVIGCIFGYMTIVIANANRWATAAAFTVFNGICMYAASDNYNVYELVARNAGFTAPMVMLGTGYPDNPNSIDITAGAALGRVLHTVVGILLLLCISQVLLPIRASQQVHSRSLKALKSLDCVITDTLQTYLMFLHEAGEQNIAQGAMLPNADVDQSAAVRQRSSETLRLQSGLGKITSNAPSAAQNLSNVRQMLDRSRGMYQNQQAFSVRDGNPSRIRYDPTSRIAAIEKELNALSETIPEAEIEPELWYTPFSEQAVLYHNFVSILQRCIRAVTAINESRRSLLRQHAYYLQRLSNWKKEECAAIDSEEDSVLSGIHLLLPLIPKMHRLQLAISETTNNIIAILHLLENIHTNQRTRFKHRQDEANRRKASFHERNAREIREMSKAYGAPEDEESPGGRKASLLTHLNDIEPHISKRQQEEVQNAKVVLLSLEKSSDSVSDCLEDFQKLFARFTEARILETRQARLDHEVSPEDDTAEVEIRGQQQGKKDSQNDIQTQKASEGKQGMKRSSQQNEKEGSPQQELPPLGSSAPSTESAPFKSLAEQKGMPASTRIKAPSAETTSQFEGDFSAHSTARKREARRKQGYDLGPGRGPSAFSNAIVLNINTVAFGLQQLSGGVCDLSSCAARLYYSKLLSTTKLFKKPWDIYSELVKRLPWQLTVARAGDDENV